MAPPDPKADRQERLAAKLRENLRRRKAQARDTGDTSDADEQGTGGLSKTPPKS